MLFETVLMSYLYRIHPGNSSVTVGIPVLNRGNAKEKNIAGMFISTMPLTITSEEKMTAMVLAKKITSGHMEIFRHRKYPYSVILKNLREKQSFEGNLYDVMISYQNAATGTGARTKWYSNGYSEVPFTMHIDNRDGNDNHTITIDYQTRLFNEEKEVELIIDRLWYMLEQICDNPEIAIENLAVMTEKEKNILLHKFNDTFLEYPEEKCIQDFFMKQVEKNPEQIALVAGAEKYTYRELDEKSGALAQKLISLGIAEEKVVGAYLERNAYTVISQLAVLKAGGVFLPIDHRYPKDRIDYMLADCKVELVLADEELGKEWNVDYLNLNTYDFKDVLEMPVKTSPEAPCYVIYTSGSTGKPKGCVLKHKGVANFCINNNIVEYA